MVVTGMIWGIGETLSHTVTGSGVQPVNLRGLLGVGVVGKYQDLALPCFAFSFIEEYTKRQRFVFLNSKDGNHNYAQEKRG